MVDFSWSGFLETFIQLFVIMDPFISIPAFIAVTKKFSPVDRKKSAGNAVLIAAIPILLFSFAGMALFDFLGITLSDFKIGGGIILLLLGIELVLHLELSKNKDKSNPSASAVVIGVPLITGPGVITITIISVVNYGLLITLSAGALALLLTYLLLRGSSKIQNALGESNLEIISRFMGLILTAIAINFITRGIGELTSKGVQNILTKIR